MINKVTVQPTARWLRQTITLPPKFGYHKQLTRKRSHYEPFEIEDIEAEAIAEYLEKNFLAWRLDSLLSNPKNESDLDRPGVKRQKAVIDYLTNQPKEKLMEIPGVGGKRSDEIIECRNTETITWTIANRLLNDSQLKALIAINESQ
jgi:hypothetical protein